MLWDIFCKVIDNHGDIGVCWRLSVELAGRGEQVRLWVDDASALSWMAPHGAPGVTVRPWTAQGEAEPGDVAIEAFGCELEPSFQAALAARSRRDGRQPPWINLEYLTAERFAERNHGLPSPVLAGPAAGLTKRFFYPGFSTATGGLLRERDLGDRRAAFDRDGWLHAQGISRRPGARLVSLFCYEPPALPSLLAQWARDPAPTRLLVTAGRAEAAVREAMQRLDATQPGWRRGGSLAIDWLPLLTQRDFDHLLWACDLNFVRGEDSLVRALWAGRPFVWQLYPQPDAAHYAKLDAFLDWLEAPPSWRRFHRLWNAVSDDVACFDFDRWAICAEAARQRLMGQPDLVTQLMRFVPSA
jgi:uncharacterized repeat protein (TIGR03837 family)